MRSQMVILFSLLMEDEYLRAKQEICGFSLKMKKAEQYFGSKFFGKNLKVLDMGCGKQFPAGYLFSLKGYEVTCLDIIYTVPYPSLTGYWHSLISNGLLETARFLQLDIMRKRSSFHDNLKAMYEARAKQVADSHIRFVQGDAEKLDMFKNETFDLIYSQNLCEHLNDLSSSIKRVKETLKPNSVCIQDIHLFTSITGGHNPRWYDFKNFQPWNHLIAGKFVLP